MNALTVLGFRKETRGALVGVHPFSCLTYLILSMRPRHMFVQLFDCLEADVHPVFGEVFSLVARPC